MSAITTHSYLTSVSEVWRDGSMCGMAKDKVTITLDRTKASQARSLVGAGSTSEVIDLALDRLIWAERLRADITAYQRVPPTDAEAQLAAVGDLSALGDDTDWEALYGVDDDAP
ncbi:MAG: hypothetical protein JWM17_2562 [Actinobacteria bacterium]|jgi:hypothetical protein|nr:hypothetical protein [Actinomycetota bacterium]MEA2593033.1 hypothetical protein [Actinomycetota bacterium]